MVPNENRPPRSHTSGPEPASEVPAPPIDPTPGAPPPPTQAQPIKRTRVSGAWVAITIAAVVLIFLLIFILQNLASATVYYLGAVGTLPLGVAMLVAAVGGALLVTLVGTARIIQLRRLAKRRGTRPADQSG